MTDTNAKATITSSSSSSGDGSKGSSTITGAPPQPTVITTVSVINGTTTTMTITVTPSAGGGGAGAAGATPATLLPKAPQSIIVIQDTPFGKVLPAAGPANDEIESHFWDQYVPHSGPGKSSANTVSAIKNKDAGLMGGWRHVFFSLFSAQYVLWTAVCVVFGLVNA
ncbi:hypothetical protein BGZ96_004348 [Linnemannia gamsii]|uniref:Uncharacterized protein n=1 Tax=Linnemannia gamsii TaxID=64522 RepID=A0ABQ7K5U0_9FUNG|nr:hypothetical protein BGZ96_004348 [Linnemannia gamsii]